MTLHQLQDLKNSNTIEAATTLKHMRNDKARADKILLEILALIKPSSEAAVRVSTPVIR